MKCGEEYLACKMYDNERWPERILEWGNPQKKKSEAVHLQRGRYKLIRPRKVNGAWKKKIGTSESFGWI